MVNERLISERARREKATHSLPPQPGRGVSTSSATTGTEDGLLARSFSMTFAVRSRRGLASSARRCESIPLTSSGSGGGNQKVVCTQRVCEKLAPDHLAAQQDRSHARRTGKVLAGLRG